MRKEENNRNSSIELLKIIAIIMIVFSHSLPNSGGGNPSFVDLSKATSSVQQLILVFMKYAGQLGNNIFIVSSAWFLLDNKKANVNKVVHIVADSFVISALATGVLLLVGFSLPTTEVIKSLIPITMNANWFVGCYLIFYLIHPALNTVIRSMEQRKLLSINLVIGFFYCVIQTMIRDRYYYTSVVGFICIYFFVAYVKEYMKDFCLDKKRNRKCFACSAIAFTISVIGMDIIGLKVGLLRNYLTTWSVITNPFLILMAITLFNLFCGRTFYSQIINYLSGLSLLVYMIHGNRFVQDILKMKVFSHLYELGLYKNVVLVCCCMGVMLLIGGFVIATLYKMVIGKKLYGVCIRIQQIINLILEKMVNALLQVK